MSRTLRSTLLVLAALAVVSLLVLTPTRIVRAQSYNVCYNLLEPIWNPPSYTDIFECRSEWWFCLSLPHCCLPACRLFPECIVAKQVLRPGFWQYGSCEVLPPEKILELFLRGQLSHLDDVVLPGVQEAAYSHVLALRALAVPVPPGVQSLLRQLLASQIGAGMPSFNMGHVQHARLLPLGTATAELYLRPGYDAITLNDLIIIDDSEYATLMSTSIPANAPLSSMQPGGSLNAQFAYAFGLLAHELVHVRQYDELGADAFLNNYLLETLTRGYGSDSFEGEANAYESALVSFLGGSHTGTSGPPTPSSSSSSSCRRACAFELDSCMSEVGERGGPLPRYCVQASASCRKSCPP